MSEADVVDIEWARPVWLHGACGCGACGALWIGIVHEVRLHALECPHCGLFAGVFVVHGDSLGEEWSEDPHWIDQNDGAKRHDIRGEMT